VDEQGELLTFGAHYRWMEKYPSINFNINITIVKAKKKKRANGI
jgi:hypothetical protein